MVDPELVAATLRGMSQIWLVDDCRPNFWARCYYCGEWKRLIVAERDAEAFYCCNKLVRCAAYRKELGVMAWMPSSQRGLKAAGVKDYDKIYTYEEWTKKRRW